MIRQEKENLKIDILKKEFPECFDREGNFNIEKFQEIISPETKLFKDSYGLNWLGKSYARALAQVEARTMIREDVDHNKKDENKDSENIYIKGDNLEVLRHLNNGYRERIKMIYIDPPYNTKNGEFVYNDNRDFNKMELDKLIEARIIDEDEKERILKWEGSSSSHSAWLTFMYPRLYLARKLLTEDGAILISIDNNEFSQLKLICDEIYGEENFVSDLVWEKKKKGSFLSKDITGIKENILIYSKNKRSFNGLIGEIKTEVETYPCINAPNKRTVITIPKGIISKYREKNYIKKKGEIISASTMSLVLHSDLVIEDGVLVKDLVIEGNWRYKEDSMRNYALSKKLYITQDLYIRRIVDETREKTMKDLLTRVGTIQEKNMRI